MPTVSRCRPNTRAASCTLIPSTITARRTRRYTSTLYIRRTIHGVGYNPMNDGGRYSIQSPILSNLQPTRPTLPPPFTLRGDGSPFCWPPVEGRLRSNVDVTPPDGVVLSSISSGGQGHVCGLRYDGAPLCWGNDNSGQASPPVGESLVSISSGRSHTCGLRADGTPVCWGSNRDHWNGNANQASPPLGETLITISSGGAHTCGLRPDGSAVCWGSNNTSYGGYTGQSLAPEGERFVDISSGGNHTCALRADGAAVCWGAGQNTNGPATSPVKEKFIAISSGGAHTCALRPDGQRSAGGPLVLNQIRIGRDRGDGVCVWRLGQ